MMSQDIETRSVELAEAKAGIKLGAGHRVVLVVSGVKGTRRYLSKARARAENESTDADRAGGASEESGGDFVLEVQLHAAGGTPLANERVRIHDPDTGKQVGQPAVTDENGVLKARVPAEKEYEIHLDTDAPEEHPDAFGEQDHPLPGQLPHPDEHAVLHVAFVDAKGGPIKREAVTVKDEHGQSQQSKTDDTGQLELVVEHGPFTLEARGSSFKAHSVFTGDLVEDGAPYRFVMP